MILKTKADMYALYDKGRFGNRLKCWPDLDSFYMSDYSGPVVMRYKGCGGQWCEYGVLPHDVPCVVKRWVSEGASERLIVINELADDNLLIIQGEVWRSPTGLHVRYTTEPMPMRKALAKSQHHATGVNAHMVLGLMDPQSRSELDELLDDFDGAVIEFSVWSKDVGDCPRRNTVFWEVRHY